MTVYHGTIVTVNANDDVFQYLVEHKGRIVYVGNTLPKKYRRAPVVELGSRALIPPFADTHQHFASFSAFNAGLNVMEARSNAEILTIPLQCGDPHHGGSLCRRMSFQNADRLRRVPLLRGRATPCEPRGAGRASMSRSAARWKRARSRTW